MNKVKNNGSVYCHILNKLNYPEVQRTKVNHSKRLLFSEQAKLELKEHEKRKRQD